MSGYQRMISYLYRYDNGVKGANVGYARIELRGEKCRVTIQLQDSLTVLPEVDFFIQRDEGLQKITAGRLVRNGNGFGARVETKSNQIMNTQFRFSDIDGMILPVSGEVFYATTWKEIVIHTGRSEWEDNSERGTGGDNPERRMGENTPEKEIGNDNPGRSVEERTPDKGIGNDNPGRNVGERRPDKGIGNDTPGRSVEEGTPDKGTGNDTLGRNVGERRPDKGTGNGNPMRGVGENTPERGIGNRIPKGNAEEGMSEKGVEGGRPGNSMREQEAGSRASEESFGNPVREEIAKRAVDLEASEQPCASGMAASCEPRERCCEQCPRRREEKDFGRHILSMFPKMYPFEIENMGECVRLDLKDIGNLPVRYWSLAGNPFLLHGYYCYRHLIFTQTGQGKSAIGVPGIYNLDNENRAKECGFGKFQTLSEVRDRQGAFGYWLYFVA